MGHIPHPRHTNPDSLRVLGPSSRQGRRPCLPTQDPRASRLQLWKFVLLGLPRQSRVAPALPISAASLLPPTQLAPAAAQFPGEAAAWAGSFPPSEPLIFCPQADPLRNGRALVRGGSARHRAECWQRLSAGHICFLFGAESGSSWSQVGTR